MDTGRLFRYFEQNGWTIASDPGQADVVLVGTCGFSQEAEDNCLDLISGLVKRAKPSATIVAFGCLPGINEAALTSRFKVIPLVRSQLNRLDEIIDARLPISQVGDANVIDEYVHSASKVFSQTDRSRAKLRPSAWRFAMGAAVWLTRQHSQCQWRESDKDVFNIRVATGCLSECTYCAIRKAAGRLQSKRLDMIREEFESGLSDGFTKFRLVAEDVGAYGQDMGSSIVELLTTLFGHQGDFKICWDDFHPEWLIKYSRELLPLLSKNADRIGYAGFPIQSGSDRILKVMRRNYSARDVVECFGALRDACPDLQIDTHIMIGFPGESREDFAQTLQLLEAVEFRYAGPFVYADRPETEASEMPHRVSLLTKALRFYRFRRKVAELKKSAGVRARV